MFMVEHPQCLEQNTITGKIQRLPKQCVLPVALLINGEVSGRKLCVLAGIDSIASLIICRGEQKLG